MIPATADELLADPRLGLVVLDAVQIRGSIGSLLRVQAVALAVDCLLDGRPVPESLAAPAHAVLLWARTLDLEARVPKLEEQLVEASGVVTW